MTSDENQTRRIEGLTVSIEILAASIKSLAVVTEEQGNQLFLLREVVRTILEALPDRETLRITLNPEQLNMIADRILEQIEVDIHEIAELAGNPMEASG